MAQSYSNRKWNKENRKKTAQTLPRDAKGHFLPVKPLSKTVSQNEAKTTTKTDGSGKVISDLLTVKKGDKNDNHSLIDVKITNPLERITEILQQIRNKQATTVSMKMTIPLIALPIVILAVFQIGRMQAVCQSHVQTIPGTLQQIVIDVPAPYSGWFSSLKSTIPFVGSREMRRQNQLLLETYDSKMIHVESERSLQSFIKQPVLVTGEYDVCKNEISVDSNQNVWLRN